MKFNALSATRAHTHSSSPHAEAHVHLFWCWPLWHDKNSNSLWFNLQKIWHTLSKTKTLLFDTHTVCSLFQNFHFTFSGHFSLSLRGSPFNSIFDGGWSNSLFCCISWAQWAKATPHNSNSNKNKIYDVWVKCGTSVRSHCYSYLRKNKEPSGKTTRRSDGTSGVPLWYLLKGKIKNIFIKITKFHYKCILISILLRKYTAKWSAGSALNVVHRMLFIDLNACLFCSKTKYIVKVRPISLRCSFWLTKWSWK